jgi:hypothetical protein
VHRYGGNCGWYGHKTDSCWEEGGAKHGQAPKNWKPQGKQSKSDSKRSPQANAAMTTTTTESDGVWLAEATAVEETMATITLPYAMLARSSIVELYDSGASQHFSPFCERFVKFESIPPRPISTADKWMFHAVGCGDLYIKIPNSSTATQVLLKDILYASANLPPPDTQLFSVIPHATSSTLERNLLGRSKSVTAYIISNTRKRLLPARPVLMKYSPCRATSPSVTHQPCLDL